MIHKDKYHKNVVHSILYCLIYDFVWMWGVPEYFLYTEFKEINSCFLLYNESMFCLPIDNYFLQRSKLIHSSYLSIALTLTGLVLFSGLDCCYDEVCNCRYFFTNCSIWLKRKFFPRRYSSNIAGRDSVV